MIDERYKKSLIFYLSLIGFFGIFTTTMAKNPVLPLFIKEMGGTAQIIGIISAISPLAGILFSFPIGVMSDRIGRRKILILSGSVFLVAPLLYILVSNPWLLIPVRFFHGLATAILGPVASAAIAEAYAEHKGEALGTYSSATLIGRTLAPITGGALISYFMFKGGLFPFKAVYIAAFFASIPAFIFSFFVKDAEAKPGERKPALAMFVDSIKYIFGDARLVSTALVDMAIYFAFGAFETYLPIYLDSKGFSAGAIGMIFSAQILSIALTKPLFGKLADRIDKRFQIAIGLVTIAASMFVLPFFSAVVLVVGVSLLFGLGMSFATVATSAYTGDVADKTRLGAAMGALSSVMDVGHSSGPAVTGFIMGMVSVDPKIISPAGFYSGFISAAGLCVAIALIFLMVAYRKTRDSA